jgi:hypothetical protein
MSFEHRATGDLIRLAIAGAGFTLSAAHRPTQDLIRIAIAAQSGGGQVTFTGLTHRPLNDLIRIGVAGKGHVTLEG